MLRRLILIMIPIVIYGIWVMFDPSIWPSMNSAEPTGTHDTGILSRLLQVISGGSREDHEVLIHHLVVLVGSFLIFVFLAQFRSASYTDQFVSGRRPIRSPFVASLVLKYLSWMLK